MRARAAALAALALAPGGRRVRRPGARRGGPAGPLRAVGSTLHDPQGRSSCLHGLFAVWKQPPYVPAGADDPADPAHPSFTDADADAIRRLGLDGVRLAWFWQGLEPSPGPLQHRLPRRAGRRAGAARAARGVHGPRQPPGPVRPAVRGQAGLPGLGGALGRAAGRARAVGPVLRRVALPARLLPPGDRARLRPPLRRRAASAAATCAGRSGRPGRSSRAASRGAPMVVGYDLVNEPFPGRPATPSASTRPAPRPPAAPATTARRCSPSRRSWPARSAASTGGAPSSTSRRSSSTAASRTASPHRRPTCAPPGCRSTTSARRGPSTR